MMQEWSDYVDSLRTNAASAGILTRPDASLTDPTST
jgi:hypothetical protein